MSEPVEPKLEGALSIAAGLVGLVGGSSVTAAHLADAITTYRREQRSLGQSVPPSLMVLQELFASLAVGSQRVIGGQVGAALDRSGGSIQGGVHDGAMPDLLTRRQAALRMRCDVSTVKRRERAGELASVRHGRIVLYRLTDIDELLKRRKS